MMLPFLLLLAQATVFEQYAVTERYTGKVARPVLATVKDRQYRTRLREAADGKPNFAGHYIVTVFGCGASCVMGAVLDATTGRVSWFPFTVCCWSSTGDDFKPVEYRLDSKLIAFRGMRDEAGKEGVYFYKLEDGKFIEVK